MIMLNESEIRRKIQFFLGIEIPEQNPLFDFDISLGLKLGEKNQ